MKFEIDVLIIFADRDNETNETGWVSQFKRFLDLMLTQVLGKKPNILLKSESDTITSPSLNNAAVLVTILSRDFIHTARCLEYIETFYSTSKNSTSKYNRIFKVFKSPLSTHEQPPRLREWLGYEMYQLDPESGDIREYTDYFSTEAERQYWMKLVDLAFDIYDVLSLLKEDTQPVVKNMFGRKTIYLAETGHDLSVQRNIIKRELTRHGYTVLPNQTLPASLTDLEKTILKDLEESQLSIHLIGAAYGEIPAGTEKSIVEIQNSLAAEKSKRAKEIGENFSRLIWISPNLTHASQLQHAFIEKIKRDTETQEGAEILQTPIEDFKNIMREELLETGEKKGLTASDKRIVYLVYDRVDQSDVNPFATVIAESGYDVLTPEFDGDLLALRKKHIENLRTFDAAVIYKGKVNEQWVRMKVLDLLKAPGFGRKKSIIGKLIIAAPDSSLNMDAFKNHDLRIIEGDKQKSLESLKTYLQEFKD